MIHTEILKQQLARYSIKETLGSGGMATVYRAEDNNLKRDVAIKVLHQHLGYDPTFKDRFEQEARLIASLNHPNIVQVYDFDTLDAGDETVYFMVMPYFSGKTLVDVLCDCREKETTLSHDRVLQIIQDLASALDYAHARDMVHRDVKPANILFDADNRPILTDFGIARLAQGANLTLDGNIVGTPAYMSPEQVTGQMIDGRSDIYALGIILFELLTGRTPFVDNNESAMSLLIKHAQEMPPEVSEFMDMENLALNRVLNRALAKLPEARFQTANGLATNLEKAFNEETTTERIKPHTIPKRPDGDFQEKPKRTQFTTFEMLVLRPARQNPFGIVAIIIAIVALLFATRVMQSSTPSQATNNNDPEVAINSMVIDEFYFESTFEALDETNEYWEQGDTSMINRIIDDGVYTLTNLRAGTANNALFDPTFEYTNAIIEMTGTISADSADANSAFGIVFRYLSPDNYNVFAVDGMGRYSIWVRADGQWRELRDSAENWTENAAINPIGEENKLILTIADNTITAYVNEEMVIVLDDDTFDLGGVGVYLASTRNGDAIATIDTFSVTPSSAVDSMTDEDFGNSMTGEATEQANAGS